jgi:tetratricopeptide (TPR) repeat protein
MKPLVAVLALAAVAGSALPARAQKAGAPEQKVAPAESPKLEDAQRRFQRGIELYREADFNAALVEFKRAHEMVPSYKILYNLGQVSYQRHDYAGALRYFRQYLDEGGAAIATDRRLEV